MTFLQIAPLVGAAILGLVWDNIVYRVCLVSGAFVWSTYCMPASTDSVECF
jgi:hypothetical protein